MCRIAAYLGPSLKLDRFLREPPHSLYRQSWEPREMRTAKVNADGWGVGWYAPDNKPAVYRNPLPIWADANLAPLGRTLAAPLWLANVRSATAGHGTDMANTQPFADRRLLFAHNGFIEGFAHTLRRRLRGSLPEEIEAQIDGNTDSEHFFALVRAAGGETQAALTAAIHRLTEWLASTQTTALLNALATDGQGLYAVRAAINADPPSLYYHECYPPFGGAVVASEAFDDDSGWRPVPPQHSLRLAPGEPVRLQPL